LTSIKLQCWDIKTMWRP